MLLDKLYPIPVPDDTWLTRLRRNHYAWLPKENGFCQITWAWEPPDPGCFAGKIGITRLHRVGDQFWVDRNFEVWYVTADGKGMDGKPILLPLNDNCPDEPAPISEPWVRQTERAISYLVSRIEQLESEVSYLRMNRNIF